HPAPLPEPAGGDHGLPIGAVDQGPPAAYDGHLAGGGAGVRAGGLPAPHVTAVRLVRLPALLPRLRRGPGASPGPLGDPRQLTTVSPFSRTRGCVARFDDAVASAMDRLRGRPAVE